MTTPFVQFAQTPLPTDVPYANYGTSDIAAGQVVCLDTTAGNLLGVDTTRPLPGVALAGADGAYPLGVTMEILKASGGIGRVRTQGLAQVTASGTVTAGGILMAESGTGSVKTQTAAKAQIGVAVVGNTTGLNLLCQIAIANNA